jgi:sugar phosphate isomerase/epimerase
MLTRREFGSLALAGLVRLKPDATYASTVAGVRLGVQTYSFRDVPRTAEGDMIEPLIRAMVACGFDECELWAPQVEPAGKSRAEQRSWRLQTPLDYFRGIKKKFDAHGIAIYGFNYSPKADYTDAEIERGFEITKALGAEIITASTTLDVAKRIAPFAERHRTIVAMHGHSNVTDPNEFATPNSFAAAMKMSKYFRINLDIGHFTAANFDPVAYIREHHASITNLHLKDRRKNQGANVPWGEGETPIREVLQLLKKERWPIPAYVEYEYPGKGTPIEESKACLAYAQRMLA